MLDYICFFEFIIYFHALQNARRAIADSYYYTQKSGAGVCPGAALLRAIIAIVLILSIPRFHYDVYDAEYHMA